MVKICKKCKVEKDELDYHVHKIKDGRVYLRNVCKICVRKSNLEYLNRDDIKIKKKEYSKLYLSKKEVKERKRHINRDYYINNKNSINKKLRLRMKEDILFGLKKKLRSTISCSLKGYKKNLKTEKIIGCSFDEFKIYIENKFENWMNWSNHGIYKINEYNIGWDIDHIIPLSSAVNEEEIYKLNHFTNLQPLCIK